MSVVSCELTEGMRAHLLDRVNTRLTVVAALPDVPTDLHVLLVFSGRIVGGFVAQPQVGRAWSLSPVEDHPTWVHVAAQCEVLTASRELVDAVKASLAHAALTTENVARVLGEDLTTAHQRHGVELRNAHHTARAREGALHDMMLALIARLRPTPPGPEEAR